MPVVKSTTKEIDPETAFTDVDALVAKLKKAVTDGAGEVSFLLVAVTPDGAHSDHVEAIGEFRPGHIFSIEKACIDVLTSTVKTHAAELLTEFGGANSEQVKH